MAFRRSNNMSRQGFNRSSRFTRRFRPTGNDRKTRPTQRYEWGEIHTDNEDILPDFPGVTTVVYTQLAVNNTIGDPNTNQGRAIGSAVRHLDVGGVVLDYELSPANGPDGDILTNLLEGKMYAMAAIVVDRLTSSGQPVSVATWDPFDSSLPATDPSAPVVVRDFLRPQRLLWQRTVCWDYSMRSIVNDAEGTLYVPNDQRVGIRNPTLNKRLRVRLTDTLGLYFVRAYRPSSTFTMPFVPLADFWLRGSIYYRYSF